MKCEEGESNDARITYAQEWPAYNKAQCREKPLFMYLLSVLCNNIEQPSYKFGRPTLSLSDMVFSSVFKVYTMYSGRRFTGDMQIAEEKGYVDKIPHFNSVFNYLKKPEMTDVLLNLIHLSSLPLASVERDFAIDATGFSTCNYVRWFDHKFGKKVDTKIWLKLHVMCGVKTNIVTSAIVTDSKDGDSPFLKYMVKETAEKFNINEVSADKAYSSRENVTEIDKYGATPYIPFRSNATGKSRGSVVWRRMFNYFQWKQKEFMEHYHKRSNVETTMHMIKAKFGSNLKSKTRTAQTNELLAKVLCHNICVVIQEMHELGINSSS